MEWIACSERMPEMLHAGRWDEKTSVPVLAYRHVIRVMEVLRLEPAGWSYDDDGALIALDNVSHWMPLPAPPVAQPTRNGPAFDAAMQRPNGLRPGDTVSSIGLSVAELEAQMRQALGEDAP